MQRSWRWAPGGLYLFDHRFYYTLLPNPKYGPNGTWLFKEHDQANILDKLMVCYNASFLPGDPKPWVTQNGKGKHGFAIFESYVEFHTYLENFQESERAFFEVILGNHTQKPHFDIDIEGTKLWALLPVQPSNPDEEQEALTVVARYIRDAVITGIIGCFADKNLTLDLTKDLLIFSSHGSAKRSFHIVVTNYYHGHNDEARAFYDAVIPYVNEKFRDFVDWKVYSTLQQFRIFGCRKFGTDRPKRLITTFNYQNHEYTHQYNTSFNVEDLDLLNSRILSESLVTFTFEGRKLPSWIIDKPERVTNYDSEGVSSEQVQLCLDMLAAAIPHHPFIFSPDRSHGRLLSLLRNAPSRCPVCSEITGIEVVHDNENPIIIIYPDNRVMWDCNRRNDKRRFEIGVLPVAIYQGPLDDNAGELAQELVNTLPDLTIGIDNPMIYQVRPSVIHDDRPLCSLGVYHMSAEQREAILTERIAQLNLPLLTDSPIASVPSPCPSVETIDENPTLTFELPMIRAEPPIIGPELQSLEIEQDIIIELPPIDCQISSCSVINGDFEIFTLGAPQPVDQTQQEYLAQLAAHKTKPLIPTRANFRSLAMSAPTFGSSRPQAGRTKGLKLSTLGVNFNQNCGSIMPIRKEPSLFGSIRLDKR